MSTRSLVLATALLTMLTGSAVYSSGSGGVPQGAGTVGDSAGSAYTRGLKSRDKAWELTEKLETASGAERAKLESKIAKEFDKAIRAYRSALKAKPEMHEAHTSLGYALRKTGQYEEALVAYNRALELRPGYPEAVEYRAEAYLGLNRIEEAKEAYMMLFRADRSRADELMAAMSDWVVDRTENPEQLSVLEVEEFAGWVRERGGLAKQTAALSGAPSSSWD